MSMNLMTELLKCTQSGVYALINYERKRVYLSYSSCMSASISRLIASVKNYSTTCLDLVSDMEKLEFKVLSYDNDKVEGMLRLGWWKDKYKQEGWSFYNRFPGWKYTPVIRLINCPPDYYNYVSAVYLEDRHHRKTLVGVFRKNAAAQEFIDRYYPNTYDFPVYACNELTQKYYTRGE